MHQPKIIIGYGDIGRRVAKHYNACGLQAWHRGSENLHCDLDQGRYPALPGSAEVFYFAPPQPKGDTDQRLGALLEHWQQQGSQPRAIVLISTSGIYGDCQGRWIDENEPVKPLAARAKRRANAEQLISHYAAAHNIGTAILRVPGIYAQDRLPKKRLASGEPLLAETECPYSNRVHADDLASTAVAAMAWAAQQETVDVFNVCDDQPSSMTAYFKHIAAYLQLPAPKEISRLEAEQRLSAGMLSYLNESKRLRNKKMKAVLGVELAYPGLATGLPINPAAGS